MRRVSRPPSPKVVVVVVVVVVALAAAACGRNSRAASVSTATGGTTNSVPTATRNLNDQATTATSDATVPDTLPSVDVGRSVDSAPSTNAPPPTTAATTTDPSGHPLGTYTDWQWPPAGPAGTYTAQELNLTVVTDPGPTTGFFFAHQVGFEHGAGAYIGLQTQAATAPGPGAPLGKIAIFSVFAGCDANAPTPACADFFRQLLGASSPAQPIPGNGSFCLPLTDAKGNAPEGPGASCRMPFDWQAGTTYRLRVTLVASHIWLASLVNASSGVVTGIGRIRVPDQWGGLTASSVSWIEDYRDAARSRACHDIGPATARWDSAAGTQLVTGGLLGMATSSTAVVPSSTRNHLSVGADLCANSSIADLSPPALGARQTVGG